MTSILLAKPCAFCRSSRWCGRECANAPKLSVTHDVTDDTNDQDDDLGEAMAAVKHLFMSKGPDDENVISDAYALIHKRWPNLDGIDRGFAVGCALGFFSGQDAILAQIGKPTWADTPMPDWAMKLPTGGAA